MFAPSSFLSVEPAGVIGFRVFDIGKARQRLQEGCNLAREPQHLRVHIQNPNKDPRPRVS